MYVELKGLAILQLADELAEEEDMTLHSDGTSKHGNKYGAYQISASKQRVYSLGMVNMYRGTASHTLEMLTAVLDDVSKMSAAEAEGKAGAGNHIIANTKNKD